MFNFNLTENGLDYHYDFEDGFTVISHLDAEYLNNSGLDAYTTDESFDYELGYTEGIENKPGEYAAFTKRKEELTAWLFQKLSENRPERV